MTPSAVINLIERLDCVYSCIKQIFDLSSSLLRLEKFLLCGFLDDG